MASNITNKLIERALTEWTGIRKALEAIAAAVGGEDSPLKTIAEKLDPLYMAEYVAPEPEENDGEGGEGGEGGSDTPPADNTHGE